MTTSAWVVCAPGDPTESQWRAIRELSKDAPYFCATRFNERSRYVRVEIERATGVTDIYTVPPDGHDAHYITTIKERSI